MNIVFMGTPVFSVPCLEALINAGHNVRAVFTQPDKPKNRGHKMQMTPVKEFAVQRGITVYQPVSLRKGEEGLRSLKILEEIAPECIVVVAYGQILTKDVLSIPKYGCINVHASLLPGYRGAAPIQRAVMNGETVSGVTTMYMAEGVDTGDMILRSRTEITSDMTGEQLHDRLSVMGAELITATLEQVEKGVAPREAQNEDEACYAKMIGKDDCRIDFDKPADSVYNQIRGLSSSPGAFTFLDGKRLKVLFAEKLDRKASEPSGTVVKGEGLCVACGGEVLRLSDIQPEGGKRMKDTDYLRGRKIQEGARLG